MENLSLRFNKKYRQVAKAYIILLLVAGISFGVSLFTNISPCPLHAVFGIPCPACGMSRAFLSLPNFRQAFFYHTLFFTVPFIPFMAILSEHTRNVVSAILVVLFVGMWVVRMVLLFPHTPPMEYNNSSVLEFILARIRGVA